MESSGVPLSKDLLQDLMKKNCIPTHDDKYESMRVSQWWQLEESFKLCSNFLPHERPTASRVVSVLSSQPEDQLIFRPLALSQGTALECADKQLAALNELKSFAQTFQTPLNDGTNSCTFLGLGICDAILHEIAQGGDVDWDRIVHMSEHVINSLPSQLHGCRDSALIYDISEARDILKSRNLLKFSYQLSEERAKRTGGVIGLYLRKGDCRRNVSRDVHLQSLYVCHWCPRTVPFPGGHPLYR